MKKFLLTLFAFSFFLLFFQTKAFADSNFITSFDITYNVLGSGITHAIFNGTIENTSDTYYPSSYSLQTGFDDMENFSASDNDGPIPPNLKKTTTGQSLTLTFNKHASGVGAKVNFSFSFDTTDIAKKSGQIWEIEIPGLANQADFKDFTVHLRVPQSFGSPSYIKPYQVGDSLDFDKSVLGTSGISLAFGSLQSYGFTLDYHLKNVNLFPIQTQIALPPSTNYQDVAISDISPRPTNVAQDVDGNWLATYYLLPSQDTTVVAKGIILVSLTPKKETLSPTLKNIYLQKQQYWETDDSNIKKLATDLGTPENIFNYVVNHLHYDFSRVAGSQQRLGAATVLSNPSSAVCLEFTDLFIALARAAGIPAREIDGYANTQNQQERPLSLVQDILHAWPEYYDENQQAWIMVDPTWQNTTKGTDYFTTLDFDHVAFAIKGSSSTFPVPAGGYKLAADKDTKDVYVSFSNVTSFPNPQVSISLDSSQQFFSGIPAQGILTVKNVGTTAVTPQIVTVSTSLSSTNQSLTTNTIPPFGSSQNTIAFGQTGLLTNTKETVTIRVGGNTISKTVTIYPFFLQRRFIIGGIILAVFGLIILIIATAARSLPFFK